MMSAEQIFAANNGGRLTATRRQVLSSILKSEKALSAYELADRVRTDFDRVIPPMSVYRILDVLIEAKLVHKVSLVNKYIVCSHFNCKHKHTMARFLVCKDCHRVNESMEQTAAVRKLEKNIEDSGFHLMNKQIEISCLCHKCAE